MFKRNFRVFSTKLLGGKRGRREGRKREKRKEEKKESEEGEKRKKKKKRGKKKMKRMREEKRGSFRKRRWKTGFIIIPWDFACVLSFIWVLQEHNPWSQESIFTESESSDFIVFTKILRSGETFQLQRERRKSGKRENLKRFVGSPSNGRKWKERGGP